MAVRLSNAFRWWAAERNAEFLINYLATTSAISKTENIPQECVSQRGATQDDKRHRIDVHQTFNQHQSQVSERLVFDGGRGPPIPE